MGIYDRDYYRTDGSRFARSMDTTPGGLGLGRLTMWSVNTWIIAINVAVFVIGKIIASIAHVDYFSEYGNFNTLDAFLRVEVWRFITFQFLHANLSHILFNMIGLYFFGPMVERYLGSRRYLAYYLICGISGAGMYFVLNFLGLLVAITLGPGVLHALPFLLYDPKVGMGVHTPLIGASAGVFGVLMAGAYIAPKATVMLLFPPIPMKLRTLAYALVGIAFFVVLTQGRNAGGQAAHIGGAIAGYFFIRHPGPLRDFLADFTRSPGKAKKTSYTRHPGGSAFSGKKVDDEAVDRILSKVATHGLHSLTKAEKRILQKASEQQRRGQ